MNTINPSRRATAAPEPAASVRPGAGVMGLARPEPAAKAPPEPEAAREGTLIVGEGIHVKGEIESCNTLIVEGKVEASLEASVLTVRHGGLYSGRAAVRSASIDGRFEGELTVDGLLTVEAGGRVTGTLRYRELKIAQGGRLSGDVDLLGEAESGREPAARAPAEPRSQKAASEEELEADLLKGARASR